MHLLIQGVWEGGPYLTKHLRLFYRVKGARRETVDLVAAGVTAVRKVNQEIKELQERR